jgi:hypothetical protein
LLAVAIFLAEGNLCNKFIKLLVKILDWKDFYYNLSFVELFKDFVESCEATHILFEFTANEFVPIWIGDVVMKRIFRNVNTYKIHIFSPRFSIVWKSAFYNHPSNTALEGQSSIGFMGGRWVANKLLHELKSSDKVGVLLPTHFLKKIVVYAYIVSSNIIEDTLMLK